MNTKKSSNSIDTDTIELFSRDDIRYLNTRNEKTKNYFNFSIISLALILFIAISTITLIRFSYSHNNSYEIVEPKVEEVMDSQLNDFIFNFVPQNDTNSNDKTVSEPHSRPLINAQCSNIEDRDKFDCNPEEPISEEVCLQRGCCWKSNGSVTTTIAPNGDNTTQNNPPLGVPYCYFGTDYVGYEVTNIEYYLYRTVVTLDRKICSGFIRDSQTVKLEVIELNEHSVRIKFYDPMVRRYEVPIPVLNVNAEKIINKPLYKVKVSQNGFLVIVRRKTSTQVFKTDLKRLVFSDQFLQLSSDLPSDYIYGIGEHKDGFRKSAKQWKRYTLFNRDQWPVPDMNLYGSHPFYLTVEGNTKGDSNGVLLFNSNAMDIILQPKPAITWRTIGGVLDFYVLLGPKPDDVIRQYSNLVGLPTLPPYWALGFHICRFGYNSIEHLMAVFNRTRSAGIPYDVQWTDIDAMEAYKDFTYDGKHFVKLPQFVQNLHQIGMKYIPMFDPGVSASEKPGTYLPFDLGMDLDIFVKNSSGQPFLGKVWNTGSTVWVDFTDPKALVYWTELFAKYHKTVEFDGAWIDMNEPSNFYDGTPDGCSHNRLDNPQYVPGANTDPLRRRTVCMNAEQSIGVHYDVHNLYGFSEAIVTNIALRTVRKKRPVIISRSSFVGHGKYAGHWDGDIFSEWDSMRWTIPSILNFNLFAIPLIGADICGFDGNTTVELCARWSELGAFYPFSRNHNTDGTIDQDPVALGPVVTKAAKNALEMRYSLLPYLYTLFFKAHIFGDTVVRPLFFEFATDPGSYEIETQFLWGSAIMIAPTLYPNTTIVEAYLPPGVWYHLKNYTTYESKGQVYVLDSPLDTINLLLRSGHILATQLPKTTTTETRKGDFILIVGLDPNGRADGSLFWDSGDGLDNLLLREFNIFEFSAENNKLISNPKLYGFDMSPQTISKAVVIGVKTQPKSVTINGIQTSHYTFDQSLNLLTINQINGDLSQINSIVWN